MPSKKVTASPKKAATGPRKPAAKGFSIGQNIAASRTRVIKAARQNAGNITSGGIR